MKTEIQKYQKQIRQLKRELLASEKKVKKLTVDNKWAGRRMIELENKLDQAYDDIRGLEDTIYEKT